MTDTTTTSPAPAKKMWTRCNGCQDRIYNDSQDIKIHAQHCPYDLQMTIQKLTTAVFGTHEIPKGKEPLIGRLASLEETVGDLDDHITAEPALDPDGIDEDAYIDTVGVAPATNNDEYEEATTVAPATPTADLFGFSTPTGITADDIAATPWRPNDL